eukprot:774986_1
MSENFANSIFTADSEDDPVIDLTDFNIVLQFAECVRNLSKTRRESIWSQNVQLHHRVQSQTKLHHQIDDILLFLVIIYGKEQYPNEEEHLIAKLKIFITSPPFTALKKYIQQKYFPLLQNEFIRNNNYFASMIEDYAATKLSNDYADSTYSINTMSTIRTIDTMDSQMIYSQLEQKMMELFENKFKQLENKIKNIEKDMRSMKYAMSEEAKENLKVNSKIMNIEDIMDEIKIIKKQLNTRKQCKKINKKNERSKSIIEKRESIKISLHKKK